MISVFITVCCIVLFWIALAVAVDVVTTRKQRVSRVASEKKIRISVEKAEQLKEWKNNGAYDEFIVVGLTEDQIDLMAEEEVTKWKSSR